MGFLFARALPGVQATALDARSTGGTAWYCQGTAAGSPGADNGCKVWPVQGRPGTGAAKVVVHPGLDGDGFNGVYEIGGTTASLPAVPVAPPAK